MARFTWFKTIVRTEYLVDHQDKLLTRLNGVRLRGLPNGLWVPYDRVEHLRVGHSPIFWHENFVPDGWFRPAGIHELREIDGPEAAKIYADSLPLITEDEPHKEHLLGQEEEK